MCYFQNYIQNINNIIIKKNALDTCFTPWGYFLSSKKLLNVLNLLCTTYKYKLSFKLEF